MPRSPIWKSIAETLSAEIAGGQYRVGDRLPTEAQLAQRFAVNRHTIRRALASLAAGGTVHARRGAGVFVAARPGLYPIGRRVRFHQNIAASGRTPSRRFLRLESRLADAGQAGALGLPEGSPVHVVEGVSLADGQPLAVFLSVFPAERLPGFLQALEETQSVTAALSRCGVADYTRRETRVTAKRATPMIARHLQIGEGDPVLETVSLNVDAAGQPVESGTTWFAGDRVALTLASE